MAHQTIHGNKFYYDNAWYRTTGWMNDKQFETRWIMRPKRHEWQEATLIKEYVKPSNSVLELGGFIGTTSCLINDIIKNKKNHVVIEICPKYTKYLTINKEKNNKEFTIHSSKVEKIEELDKYGIKFDTLVMDIEGDEYDFISNNIDYISKNIKTIIAEFHPRHQPKAPKQGGPQLYFWHKRHPSIKLLKKCGFKPVKNIGKDSRRGKIGSYVWQRTMKNTVVDEQGRYWQLEWVSL